MRQIHDGPEPTLAPSVDTEHPRELPVTPQHQIAPLRVGESLPALCDRRDVCRAFRISLATFHRWDKAGLLRKFETARIGNQVRWSGALITKHVQTAADDGRVFGRKRA